MCNCQKYAARIEIIIDLVLDAHQAAVNSGSDPLAAVHAALATSPDSDKCRVLPFGGDRVVVIAFDRARIDAYPGGAEVCYSAPKAHRGETRPAPLAS